MFVFVPVCRSRADSSESLRLRCLHSACKHRPVAEADEVKKQLLGQEAGADAMELSSGILVDDQEEPDFRQLFSSLRIFSDFFCQFKGSGWMILVRGYSNYFKHFFWPPWARLP